MHSKTDYEVINIGALDEWRQHYGGFVPARARDGRRVVDHELDAQYIGMTANALQPGEDAGYWHTHSALEELYVFLAGSGQFAVDDDVIDVRAGTVVRVGQNVWRNWRANPDSDGELRWLCIRAGGQHRERIPNDATRDSERPTPW
ncbi:cupin domain-containing protein [Microbacterium sp. NC79]|uniref:cupin domain-containing protein n=1 Tax=Microbacterium sp. NC79 TaxID=2851009 RepID=UPI001C2C307D|nr:cupin domain-containing protein [Microbacterium sp. NC79]MBV0894885.1 cupin domain-containing protein [Microbacterium sp. NC79]